MDHLEICEEQSFSQSLNNLAKPKITVEAQRNETLQDASIGGTMTKSSKGEGSRFIEKKNPLAKCDVIAQREKNKPMSTDQRWQTFSKTFIFSPQMSCLETRIALDIKYEMEIPNSCGVSASHFRRLLDVVQYKAGFRYSKLQLRKFEREGDEFLSRTHQRDQTVRGAEAQETRHKSQPRSSDQPDSSTTTGDFWRSSIPWPTSSSSLIRQANRRGASC